MLPCSVNVHYEAPRLRCRALLVSRLLSSILPELPGHAGLKLTLQAQRGFGFLELLVNDAAENQLLIGWAQRVRGEVDAALGQLGEVGFVMPASPMSPLVSFNRVVTKRA